MNVYNVVAVILFAVFAVILSRIYFDFYPSKEYNHTRFVTRVGIFAGFSAILYVVELFTIKLPFFPNFLSLHFDEVPAFIAGFAYGPIAGLFVVLIKTVIKLPFTQTLGVGELTDLILSGVYVFTASLIYKRKRNLKGVAIGFGLATLIQVVAAMLLNVYVMIPLYACTMGYGVDALLGMMQKAIPSISDTRWSYAFLAVLPFNLIKDGIVIAITFVVYRYLHVFLRFEGKKKANH